MTDPIAAVREFISTFRASLDPELWANLIREEVKELRNADTDNEGAEAVLKETADVAYVCVGLLLTSPEDTGVVGAEREAEWNTLASEAQELVDYIIASYGFSDEVLNEAFTRVHQSNMSKLGEDGKPIRREDGKILKGPNYAPPVLTDLI